MNMLATNQQTVYGKTDAFIRHLMTSSLAIILGTFMASTDAAQLNLAPNALELAIGVEPNIVILNDDSGSMDWEIMSRDANNGGRWTGIQPDGSNPGGAGPVKHRDSDDNGAADCGFGGFGQTFFGYIYGIEFGSNTYGDDGRDCNTADDEAWRFRNYDFNPLYFNPNREYKPWVGVDINGVAFQEFPVTAVPNNPYNPTEFRDLTLNNSNWNGNFWDGVSANNQAFSIREGDAGVGIAAGDGFRFYTWTDDGDGIFENGEETEFRIKTITDVQAATWGMTAAELRQNFANWFTYHRNREYVAKAALGTVVENISNARIGYATINDNNNNDSPVASMNISPNSGNKRVLLDNIYSTNSASGTPLRRNLRNVGRYFECRSGDIFGSGANSAPGDPACPVQAAPEGACQQNYAIVMTDGFWNGGNPGVGNSDANTSNNFDGGAFADGTSDTLADVAMHYYKRDLHPTLADGVPSTSRDIAGYLGPGVLADKIHQHMSTFTISFGLSGNVAADPVDPAVAFAWPPPVPNTPTTIDDLRHTAYDGRGQFLSANDPVALDNALSVIFTEIAANVGTASSVAFNTQEVSSGATVFRAFFNTKTNTGDLLSHPVLADGTIDLATTLWSAAAQLDSTAPGSRVIVTYDALAVPKTGTEFRIANLNPTQITQLDANATLASQKLDYLRGDSTNEGIVPTAIPNFRERPTVKGKLGDIVNSTPVFVGPPPFFGRNNPPFPSTPGNLYTEFKTAQKSRVAQVYAGGNDGMGHAFNASTGNETFAYVPNVIFPKLTNLTDPAYTHEFFVDLTPSINDVFMGSWKTVLVGGMRGGGMGYYALDITDPANFSSETSAKNQVMWEFTPADDVGGLPINNDNNLGFTYSRPLLAMSNINKGALPDYKKWVAIFGNGYNSASPDGDAELYVAFIEDGQDGVWTRGSDFIKLTTGIGKAEMTAGNNVLAAFQNVPNGLGDIRGVDVDQDGTVDIVYAGDLQGNLYRFNISDTNTALWTVQKIFTAAFGSAAGPRQPITKSPIVVKHPTQPGFIVIFGTGSWTTTEDATSTNIQSIYGVWDNFTSPSDAVVPVQYSRLQQQTFTNQGFQTFGGQSFNVRTLSQNTFNWGITGTDKQGWRIDLDVPCIDTSFCAAIGNVEFPGERAVRNFQFRGGFVFVNTIIPKSSVSCDAAPGGFALGFDPIFGKALDQQQAFDLNNDGVFDENDNVGASTANANIVAGTRFEGGTPTDSSFIGDKRTTQTSDLGVESINAGGNTFPNGARNAWQETDF